MPDMTNPPTSGIADERQSVNAPETETFIAWTDRTDRIMQFEFQTFTCQEWSEFRTFFDRMAGRAKAFFQPSWAADFELAVTAAAGDTTLTIAGHWHTNNLNSNRPDSIGRRMLIVNHLGEISDHWVLEAATSGANDVLTLEDPIANDLEPGRCIICICYLCRLAMDSIEGTSLSPAHVNAKLTFREITNRRKHNDHLDTQGFVSIGNLIACAEVWAFDDEPAFSVLRNYSTLGPDVYDTPQAGNFDAAWSGSLSAITNLLTLDGPAAPFTSTLYNGSTPADQIAFTFDTDGKEVLAWVTGDAARIRWFDGTAQTIDFDAHSVAAYNSWALATTTDIGDSTVVVFYLKRGDSNIYCRILADGFAVPYRYCINPLAAIALHTVNQFDGRLQLVGMDASHRVAKWRSAGWLAFGDLVITYTWPTPHEDLDTGTTFGDDTVGYGHGGSSTYMVCDYDGPNINPGPEVVVIDLAAAFLAGAIGKTAKIKCAADWYPNHTPTPGEGPATMQIDYNGHTKTIEINPGDVTPSTTNVATITVNPDGTFTLD